MVFIVPERRGLHAAQYLHGDELLVRISAAGHRVLAVAAPGPEIAVFGDCKVYDGPRIHLADIIEDALRRGVAVQPSAAPGPEPAVLAKRQDLAEHVAGLLALIP